MTKDEEIVLFHYTLGTAITQWSLVENLIANVVLCFYQNHTIGRHALAVGYFSLEGFRTKLQFADGLISRSLGTDPRKTEWKKLFDKARSLSVHRNKLAHWQIAKYWHRRPGMRVVLSPWLQKKSARKTKNPIPPDGSLTIRELYKSHLAFIALSVSLENFLHRLVGREAPHAASDEQPTSPPTVETLMRQIREVLSDQQKSSKSKLSFAK
jgi:hypothetical protein